ncbi:MAG: hypothetical protein QF503_07455 [Rhodospirillales bacterium]|nr:hypothetical protein [Rhodospirillales bacterium]
MPSSRAQSFKIGQEVGRPFNNSVKAMADMALQMKTIPPSPGLSSGR